MHKFTVHSRPHLTVHSRSLGGNRHGTLMTYRNLMLTMLLGGLWHGANWTFVAWGLYHGLLLCGFRLLNIGDTEPGGSWLKRIAWMLRVAVMFHITCFGWLLFRADTFDTVYRMCVDLAAHWHASAMVMPRLVSIVFFCGLGTIIEWWTDGENRFDRLLASSWFLQGAVVVYWALMLLFFQADSAHEFIYFQF